MLLSANHAAAADEPPGSAAIPPARTTATPDLRLPIPVGVALNGATLDDPCLVARRDGHLFVPTEAARQWGLNLPPLAGDFTFNGQAFTAIDGRTGIAARLDASGTTLLIDADHRLFPAVHFGPAQTRLARTQIIPAAFLGYDLSLIGANGRATVSTYLDGGISGAWGVLGSTAAIQSSGGFIRLNTSFQRDFPDQRLRLVIGDTLTRAGDWNLPVRFAGIQLGTDFSLTPNEITYPLPVLRGSAALPSVVDLIAANSGRRFDVQPGDFTVDYQPTFNGAGSVSMTIRDAAGNLRTVTQNFYTSPRLLRPGLDDFSLEAGFLRKDFGWSSFAYGAPFAAAAWRHGLSNMLTVFGRVEASGQSQALGVGTGLVIAPIGEFSLSAAASHSAWGDGTLWRAQFQQITAIYTISASYQEESADFMQVGGPTPDGAGRSELIVAGSVSLGRLGSISASHAEDNHGDSLRYSISSVSFSSNVGPAYVSVSARQTDSSGSRDRGVFAALTLPLGRRTTSSLFVDGGRTTATLTHIPPPDQGLGYRLLFARGGAGDPSLAEGAISWRNRAGDFELAAAQQDDATGVRFHAQGALLMTGGTIAQAQRLDSAFAVVDVESDAKAHVYFENQPVAGRAGGGTRTIVTGLQPYAANRIAVDLDDLPLDTEVTYAEQTVVPGYRQAVAVRFGGAPVHPATLTLVDAQGTVLPPGLAVSLAGGAGGVTGFDGQIYLSDARPGTAIEVHGAALACRATVPAASQNKKPVRCVAATNGEHQ